VADIARGVRALTEPGQIIEARILEAPRQGTVAGYFDSPEKLVEAVQTWNGKAPIYCTLNPVHPGLLARYNNRLETWAKKLTGDTDVTHRRRLLIDLDPVRPAGIPATDSEHEAAVALAIQIRDYLASLGWPVALELDSGNGAYLIYALDLPNDPETKGLLERLLQALDFLFSTPTVSVDTTTFNASRIARVPGTLNAKGDGTLERRARYCRLLRWPADLLPVPRDLLEAVAAKLPPTREPFKGRATGPGAGAAFDLPAWIRKYNLDVAKEGPWQDAYRYVLGRCPWNEEHTDRSAYVIQFSSGAIAAGCHHNGCQGNGWRELRQLFEPGCYERPHQSDSGQEPAEPAWPDPIPLAKIPAAKPFPLDVLPQSLGEFIQDAAAALTCPADYVAVPLLAIAGAAIGTSRVLEIKAGWRERPALFDGVTLEEPLVDGPEKVLLVAIFGYGSGRALNGGVKRRQRPLEFVPAEGLADQGGDDFFHFDGDNVAPK
jgi:hypothetical protein